MSAEQARSFERAVREYGRGRPGWPPAVLGAVPVASGSTVLDLGAGTGKLTRVWIASRDDREQVLAEPAANGEYRFLLRSDVLWTTRS